MRGKGVEWFEATGNKVWGAIAILFGLAVAVVTTLDHDGSVIVCAFLLFALLAYASMWRPRVGATGETLLLRGMYSTQSIPLASIDSIIITRTFAAHVIGRNYVSSAVGRGLRESVQGKKRPKDGSMPAMGYADLVETRLAALVADARQRHGVAQGSEEQSALAAQIRRTWAWPEMALSVVVALALVISILS